MFRFVLAAAGLSAYLAAVQASVSVTISNSCSESVALYDNSATSTLASGSSTTRTLANGYVGMFRNGESDEATLAEISVNSDGTPWFDISIIPPDSGSCTSLSACQTQTGKTGFNTAMQLSPLDNVGDDTCNVLTCEADGCDDAYQYPSDDTKTHTCPKGTSFEVTFCPGGSGTSTSTSSTTSSLTTSAPTTATPTSAPTTTPTPTPTPTSTTAAPTSTPTPTPTEAPVSTSASASASASGSSGIQVQAENYTSSASAGTTGSVSEGKAGVETAGVAMKTTTASTDVTSTQTTGTTTTGSSGSNGAVEVTTKSSDDSTSSLTYLFVIGGCVAGIASGGFIYAVQQKKKALDMETKSPMTSGDRSCRDVSVLVSTPASLSVRL